MKRIRRYAVDLHCHTDRSDGNDSPEELIGKARQAPLKGLAIVDHDIQPPLVLGRGPNQKESKVYAKERSIDLLLGYEFSCDTQAGDVHIIGYELDWKHPSIKEEVLRARQSKTNAYQRLCRMLQENGMDIDFEKDILASGSGLKKKERAEKKQVFEAMAKKGYAKSWQEAKRMVQDSAFGELHREKISPVDAIALIRDAGGLSVLAHPYLVEERLMDSVFGPILRDDYIGRLIGCGLDGIESCYTYHKTSYAGSLSPRQIQAEVERKYQGKIRFFTGGSDYHHDGARGVKDPRFLGEAGMDYQDFQKIFSSYLV